MIDQQDIKFIKSTQLASLTALPLWYPWYRATTLAKQEILTSIKPNDMSHLTNYLKPNFSVKGIFGYYRGIFGALLMQPVYPLVFYTKERLNRKLFNNKPTLSQDILLSTTLGASTALVASPLNVILTQVFKNKDATILNTTKDLYKNEGLIRFTFGTPAFIVRNGMFCAGLTVFYSRIQEMIKNKFPVLVPYKGDVIGAGIFSAFLCSGLVDFVDVIGVIRQANCSKRYYNGQPFYVHASKSGKIILEEIYYRHGIRGLFVGFVPKIIQVSTEIIVFNEMFKYFMKVL